MEVYHLELQFQVFLSHFLVCRCQKVSYAPSHSHRNTQRLILNFLRVRFPQTCWLQRGILTLQQDLQTVMFLSGCTFMEELQQRNVCFRENSWRKSSLWCREEKKKKVLRECVSRARMNREEGNHTSFIADPCSVSYQGPDTGRGRGTLECSRRRRKFAWH